MEAMLSRAVNTDTVRETVLRVFRPLYNAVIFICNILMHLLKIEHDTFDRIATLFFKKSEEMVEQRQQG